MKSTKYSAMISVNALSDTADDWLMRQPAECVQDISASYRGHKEHELFPGNLLLRILPHLYSKLHFCLQSQNNQSF